MAKKQTKQKPQSKAKSRSKVKVSDLDAPKGGSVKGGAGLSFTSIKYDYKQQ